MSDKVDLLIDILFDPTARIDEKDDAAMDLGEYDDDKALKALIKAAQDPETDEYCVLDSCGESIASIWVRRNFFSKEIFNSLRKLAKVAIFQTIVDIKPEWIKEYNISLKES